MKTPLPVWSEIAAGRSNPAALAMASASDLLEQQPEEPRRLLDDAARLLAQTTGQMCLISLASGPGQNLEPAVAAHVRPRARRRLQDMLALPGRPMPSDAFSREVARTGKSLQLRVGDPRLLALWLPPALADYARRAGVREVLAAAMYASGRVLGTVLLWREQGRPSFAAHDVLYVTNFARRLGVALAAISD